MERMGARRGRISLVIGLGLIGLQCAPVPPSARIELPTRQFSLTDVQLPSGFQVIVEDEPSANVVTSALVVSAGAADDPPGQDGLAHLVEHLTFRARHAGASSLTTSLALHGIGSWNGETEMDLTSYYLVGPPETLAYMIEAEVARMSAPLEGVDEEAFKAERGVVLAELRTRDESGHHGQLRRSLLSQLFPASHPYARGVGGTPESIAGLTLAQARAWTETHYRPSKMTWVLAGALDRTQVAVLLEQKVPPALREPRPATVSAQAARPVGIGSLPPAPATLPGVSAPVSRPTLVVGWALPPMRDRLEPILSVLPALVEGQWFGEGVTGVDTQLVSMDDATVLALSLELQPDANPNDVWTRVRGLWSKQAWNGGSLTGQYFVERVFGQLRGAAVVGLARQNESIVARTLQRAERARLTHKGTTLSAQNAAIGQLTYHDVLEAGRAYVTEAGARAVLLKPLGGPEAEGERAPGTERGAAFAPDAVRAEYPPEVLAKFVRGPRLSGAGSFKASNGLQVVTVPQGSSGLVTVTLGVRGGRLTSTPPALTDRLPWSRQSWEYHAPAIIGASLSSWWTDDTGFVEYTGAAGNLPNLLSMLAERVLTRRTTSPSKATLTRVSTTLETDAWNRRFWETLLGPAGGKAQLSVAEAAALDGDVAQRWVEQVLNPQTSVLVVAGDVKGNVKDEVEHWLGRWRGPDQARPSDASPLPAAPGVLRVVKGTLAGSKQVRVRLGCTAAASSLEDELAFGLLAAELDRQWTKVERDTLGSSYGFQHTVQVRRDGSMRMLVSGRVDPASSRRMAVAVAQSWKALGELGADENRVGRLRWEYARDYNVRFLTADAVAEDVVRHQFRGRAPAALDEVPAALQRVSRTQLAAVGQQCRASAVLGMLGESAALEVDAQLPPDARVLR